MFTVVEQVAIALADPIENALEIIQIIKLVFQHPDHARTLTCTYIQYSAFQLRLSGHIVGYTPQ